MNQSSLAEKIYKLKLKHNSLKEQASNIQIEIDSLCLELSQTEENFEKFTNNDISIIKTITPIRTILNTEKVKPFLNDYLKNNPNCKEEFFKKSGGASKFNIKINN